MKILLGTSRFGRDTTRLQALIKDALDACGAHITLNGYRLTAIRYVQELNRLPTDALDRYVALTSDLERLRDKVHALNIPADDGGFEAKQSLLKSITQALSTKGERHDA